jgi:hypothetical protein
MGMRSSRHGYSCSGSSMKSCKYSGGCSHAAADQCFAELRLACRVILINPSVREEHRQSRLFAIAE